MLFDQGKLEKMTVRAYLPTSSPDDTPELSPDPEDSYIVQVNPASYTLEHQVNYAPRQRQGDSGQDAVFRNAEPVTMDFDFLFDATGVIPPPSELGDVPLVGAVASALSDAEDCVVMDEIQKFNRVVYTYDGESHRPRKVLLSWGTLAFTCALKSASYEFKLFKPDGTPLRAQATCSFQEARTDSERALIENNSSPDLTHRATVREGDKLPLMVYRVYNDASVYMDVARSNRIINFRQLRTGAQIAMPPLGNGSRERR